MSAPDNRQGRSAGNSETSDAWRRDGMRMSPRYFLSLLLVAAFFVSVFGLHGEAAKNPDMKTLVEENTAFALALYSQLKAREGNLFLSPFSISEALAMTYAGARGQTEKEMAKVLHFRLPQDQLHKAFSDLQAKLDTYTKKGHIDLVTANALWVQRGYRFLREFLALMEGRHGAGLHEADFAGATETARQNINNWVEKQTQKKIKELFQPGVLSTSTTLVLANALYFKGRWARKFDRRLTRPDSFFIVREQTVTVDMMYQTSQFKIETFDTFKALELPYWGEDVSMVILLPNRIDGLKKLECSLTIKNFSDWMKRLRSSQTARVDIALPRFKLASDFQLKKQLSDMGMPGAFANADFSGMTGSKDLFISSIVHKAMVDVNEEGTEAAAATGIVMDSIELFRADHPFLFLIVDNSSGTILFLGRMVNPTLS